MTKYILISLLAFSACATCPTCECEPEIIYDTIYKKEIREGNIYNCDTIKFLEKDWDEQGVFLKLYINDSI